MEGLLETLGSQNFDFVKNSIVMNRVQALRSHENINC